MSEEISLSKFCPKCGEVPEKFFTEKYLCTDCYREALEEEFPKSIEIPFCRDCLCQKPSLYENIKEISKSELNFQKDYQIISGPKLNIIEDGGNQLNLEVKIEKKDVVFDFYISLISANKHCRNCRSDQKDFEFKTVVQLRGENLDDVEKTLEERLESLEEQNYDDFVLNIIEKKEGSDYFLSTEHMAHKALEAIIKTQENLHINRSYQQKGFEDGQKQFINIISVKKTESN